MPIIGRLITLVILLTVSGKRAPKASTLFIYAAITILTIFSFPERDPLSAWQEITRAFFFHLFINSSPSET